MPIAKEILSMFEFSRNLFHFDERPLSQQRSVPTKQLTFCVVVECRLKMLSYSFLHTTITELSGVYIKNKLCGETHK